jgi:hypothetical protein
VLRVGCLASEGAASRVFYRRSSAGLRGAGAWSSARHHRRASQHNAASWGTEGTTASGGNGGDSMRGTMGQWCAVVRGAVEQHRGDDGVMAPAYGERSTGAGSMTTCTTSMTFAGSLSCCVSG